MAYQTNPSLILFTFFQKDSILMASQRSIIVHHHVSVHRMWDFWSYWRATRKSFWALLMALLSSSEGRERATERARGIHILYIFPTKWWAGHGATNRVSQPSTPGGIHPESHRGNWKNAWLIGYRSKTYLTYLSLGILFIKKMIRVGEEQPQYPCIAQAFWHWKLRALVDVYITMENRSDIDGKTHYFYGHLQ